MAQQNEFEYFDSVNKFATENQSNKTQQTAVEWLIDRIKNQHLYGFTPLHELEEQAKAMEKELIMQSYIKGAEEAKKIFKEELQEFIVLPKDFTYKK